MAAPLCYKPLWKKQIKPVIEHSPDMTLKEVAAFFRVSQTSIRRASGDFAILKFTKSA